MKNGLPPLVHHNSKTLILGTMPGERSIALQQYYGNRGNHFWKILFAVFDEPFSVDYEERKMLLQRHHIALWNVLARCEREGSRDSAITKAVPNDFKIFHLQFPAIRHVCFESKSAAQFYNRYAKPQPGITYRTLPSTSGLNARLSFAEKQSEWEFLRTIQSTDNQQ